VPTARRHFAATDEVEGLLRIYQRDRGAASTTLSDQIGDFLSELARTQDPPHSTGTPSAKRRSAYEAYEKRRREFPSISNDLTK
jgi:hypothetical protein